MLVPRKLALYVLVLSVAALLSAQNSDTGLTVEEVVRLTRAGFSEDIIITKIKKNGKAFDLSTDELLDLKKDGVSDTVVKYMLDPTQPYTPPVNSPPVGSPTSKPAGPAKKYPEDSFASRVPPDPALYFFSSGAPVKVDLKFLLGSEESKSLMKKGKSTAYLIGATSKTHFKTAPIFYARLPEGKEIEELVLVGFSPKDGRRELDTGPPGPKQQLKAEDIQQFDSLEVGPHLFKLTPPKLGPGEYIFFFIGSADPPKGIYGKGYDFGVEGLPDQKSKQKSKKK
ncbi:MAG: hypothetical protein WB992_04965 [Bryobacteraceae bacterium]